MEIDLSILIPTIPSRYEQYGELLSVLMPQVSEHKNVEVLTLSDNYIVPIGEKRNKLISMAQGKYVAFVDDDDMVSGAYVAELLRAIGHAQDADVILFDMLVQFTDGSLTCQYDLFFRDFKLINERYFVGAGWHIHAWHRRIAKLLKYNPIWYGEDMDWCVRACSTAKTQHKIDKILYTYQFDALLSESRKRLFNEHIYTNSSVSG